MPLTAIQVQTAKPFEKQYKLADSGGLSLVVTPTGSKWWRLDYRHGGKRKSISLGTFPLVSLKDARLKRDDARRLIADNIDPSAERKKAKAATIEAEVREANTFEKVAREWFAKKEASLAYSTSKRNMERLEKHVFSKIGSRPIVELRKPDYVAVVQSIEARGTLDTAKRVANLCSQICRYACDLGILEYDYAAGAGATVAKSKTQHRAAITDPVEFGFLLAAIDNYQGQAVTAIALRILPYVFVRAGELRGAEWSEINLEKAEWIIPAPRMKMRRPHIVPLAPQVVALFNRIRDVTGEGRLVFPGFASREQPITDECLLNALRRIGYAREVMCLHGFRSSASTMLNEMGYRSDVIEAQLAHEQADKIRAAYNRALYLPERRQMMLEWADYIDSLKAKAKGNE